MSGKLIGASNRNKLRGIDGAPGATIRHNPRVDGRAAIPPLAPGHAALTIG